MPRMIRRIHEIRLSTIAVAAMVCLATFGVSANDQQTGTWNASAQGLRREVAGGGLIGRGAAAAVLPDGGILIAGGRTIEGQSTRVVRFDVNAGATLLAPLTIGRANLTATTLADGRVLVVGGIGADGLALATAELYENGEWTVIPMRSARAHHTATLLADGRVLIAGGDRAEGRTGSGAPRIAPTATLEIFDPATNQLAFAGVMGAARTRHAAALLPDGTVLVAGGESRNAVTGDREVLASTEILDVTAQSRHEGPSMDLARMNFTATPLVNGDVLIAGGSNGNDVTASAERYDASESRFVGVGWLQQAREGHVALRLPDNNGVLIAGGSATDGPLVSSEMFLPASGVFVTTGNTASSHVEGVISRTAVAGTAVIMGGSDTTSTEQYRFATVTTDKSDYAPGETVTITGTGWVPGELVTLELREDPFIDAHPLTPVFADADGNISSQEFAPDESDLNVTFYLTARGSVSEAVTVFTDAQPQNVTASAQNPSPVTAGNSASYTITVSFNGNSNDCTVDLTAAPSGLPAWPVPPASGFFSFSPTQITGTSSAMSTLTVATPTGMAANTYKFKVSATPRSNCQGASSAQTSADINLLVSAPTSFPTTLALAAPSPTSVTYGTSGPVTFTATLTRTSGGAAVGGATIDFTVDSVSVGTAVTNASTGVATLSTYNPSALNATGHTIQASFAGGTIGTFQYGASTSNTRPLTVNPADQAITFGALGTKTYGDADFTVSATGGGSGNAVTFTASGDCTISTATVHIVAAGSCTITAHQAGNSNYNAAPDVPQSFTINKKTVTAVIAVNDKVYDANTTATLKAVGGRTLTGVLPADETTLDFSIATLTFDTANAGPTKTVTATGIALTGTSAPNYQLSSTTATTTAAISKANATCSVTGYSVTYDANAHTATGSCLGVETETLSGLNLSATTHTDAGTYNGDGWTFTDVTGNYKDTSGTVNDAIAKANASVVVNGYSGTYDGNAHGASLDHATGVGGVDLNAGINLGASFTNVPGGTAHWTFSGGNNYFDKDGDAAITIGKADANCSVTGYSVTYDTTAHTATGSCLGVKNEILAGLDLSGTKHTNAGSFTDNWTFTDVTGNYNDTSGTVSDTIERANADCSSIAGYSVTFDGHAHTATGSCTGIGGGALTGLDLSGTTHTNAGTYNGDAWTFTDVTGNYKDAHGTVNDAIAKANADCSSITGYSVTYNAAAHTATGACKGVDGDALAGLNLSGTTHTDAGTYNGDPWTFTDVSGNYYDAHGTVDDAIAKANASVVVNGYSGTFDGNAHGATLDHATGVGGVNLSAGINLGATFTNVPGGTAQWTFSGGTNYNDQSGDVAIAIAKANAVCTSITGYSVIYDGHTHTATGNCTGVGAAVLSGLDLTPTTHTPANVYHDTWTFTDVTGNYNNTSGGLTDVITYNVCVLYDQSKPNKKGSTIPLKIMLCDAAGNNVSSPDIDVQAVTLTKVSASIPPFDAEDSGNANPDLNFRYAGGFYIFNLSTKNPLFSAGEWQLLLKVNNTPNVYTLTFFVK